MFLNNKTMAKMSEGTIAEQYSRYLQRVSTAEIARQVRGVKIINQRHFLDYNEFKEYYLLELVGKGDRDYLNKLINKMQHNSFA